MKPRGRRPSSRAVLAGVIAVLGSGGCASLLDIDDGHFVLADGGESGDDGGGDDAGGGRHDGSVGGDDGGATTDTGAADTGPFSPEDTCTSRGWHRDCNFGDFGVVTLAPALYDRPVTASDPAGNVYIVASTPTDSSYMPPSNLVTLATDGGVSQVSLPGVAPVLDVRVLDNGELAILATNPEGFLAEAARVDAGVVTDPVSTTIIVMGTTLVDVMPLRFLRLAGTTWTAAGILFGTQDPVTVDFDMDAQAASVTGTGATGLVPTAAVTIDSGTWFIGASGASTGAAFEDLPSDAGTVVEICGATPLESNAFADIAAVDDSPVGIVAQAHGFDARLVTTDATCPVLASYGAAVNGQPDQLTTTRGVVGGVDSLVVVGRAAQGSMAGLVEATLLVGHLPISPAAGDAAAPFALRVADGVASHISLAANIVVGVPVLAGPYLYVPFVADAPVDADGGGSADAGVHGVLSVVRLVYQAP